MLPKMVNAMPLFCLRKPEQGLETGISKESIFNFKARHGKNGSAINEEPAAKILEIESSFDGLGSVEIQDSLFA